MKILVMAMLTTSILTSNSKPTKSRKLIFDDDIKGDPAKQKTRFISNISANAGGLLLGALGSAGWNAESDLQVLQYSRKLKTNIEEGVKDLKAAKEKMKTQLQKASSSVEKLVGEFNNEKAEIDKELGSLRSLISGDRLGRRRVL